MVRLKGQGSLRREDEEGWEGEPLSGIVIPLRFGVNFSYYGLSLDVSRLGLNVYHTQLLFGVVELPAKLLVYVLVRHVGRRLTQAGMLLGSALALGLGLLVSSGEPRRPRPLHEAPPTPRGSASWPKAPPSPGSPYSGAS